MVHKHVSFFIFPEKQFLYFDKVMFSFHKYQKSGKGFLKTCCFKFSRKCLQSSMQERVFEKLSKFHSRFLFPNFTPPYSTPKNRRLKSFKDRRLKSFKDRRLKCLRTDARVKKCSQYDSVEMVRNIYCLECRKVIILLLM